MSPLFRSPSARGRSLTAGPSAFLPPALLLTTLLGACSDYSVLDKTPGDPFDPGPRKEGGQYGSGSGSGSGSMMPPPPMCDAPERRCAHEFVWKGEGGVTTGNEKLVELRGDYKMGGWDKGDAFKFDGKVWRLSVPVPWQTKFSYKFHIIDAANKESWLADPSNPISEPDGFGGQNSVLSGLVCDMFSCADPTPMCAAGTTGSFDWRDAVLYFVFVDRFYDGNPANNSPWSMGGVDPSANWQGGDWAGLKQKIDSGYFDQLGVNALWITVPMEGTDAIGLGTDGRNYTAYHGYWPRDLSKPEPRFGTAADLTAVVDAAHTRGIKIMIDYAMNHVHKDSPVYTMHKDWFNPLDLGGGKNCLCGSSDCPWDGDKAKVCWFTDYLPDFNFNVADARNYSIDNVLEWVTKYKLDGLRLDAVKHIEASWYLNLRQRLIADVESKTKQHIYLVGETYTGDKGLIKTFIDPCTKLDGQFDFPLRAQLDNTILLRQGKMQDLASFMDDNVSYYGTGLMSTFLGNHDVPRSIHFAQNTPLWTNIWTDGKDRNFTGKPGVVAETEAYERMGLAMAVLLTSRGVPLIYYGDEIGLSGAGDPDNRRFMDWNSAGYNAGQRFLLERHKKLGAARKAHSALRRGTRTTLSLSDDTWAYKMVDGADTVYVVLNRSDSAKAVGGLPTGSFTDQLTGDMLSGPSVMVPPRGARVLVQ
ncbi:MAG TPA: alpha-amylase family glycosyl hydrolase [Pseudomonadota bacterium]|nr:alpha-amylase family glycosyl hydrolase [Pseudomonadota bacterium]